jgi:flagellar basal body-associated protein FliL
MNARKILLVLGIIALVFVAAVVAFGIFLHRKNEIEANKEKTAKARANRWARREPVESTQKSDQDEGKEIFADLESIEKNAFGSNN